MTDESFSFEEGVFVGALALPREDRLAFIRRACAADATLCARVEALLREHEQGDGALDVMPTDSLMEVATALQAQAPVEEAIPGRIGRFRLDHKLGEGGFGVVWKAEQIEPVKRDVALKIILPGMDRREFVMRFELERQALALMDHPNIARVLDGGTTTDGRPYFVMELVPGVPITRYCDEHRLATTARLELFLHVCRAVQHAHQKGIIHRDLKPSNILVAAQDGKPVPKIIDFGIAKTIGGLPATGVTTAFPQFIGTPAYMSPEQLEPGNNNVDTRSDIYNLGVLLYELLTGQTPFDARELSASSVDQLRHILREREPPRPSTRIGALDGPTRERIALERSTGFATLQAALRGDIDWIVMCCLEKERARRYEAVSSLARDIERHLANEPVAARPPTAAYVLRKTVRRHRVAFAAGGAIAASLLLAVIGKSAEARRASAAERAALAERSRADAAREEAEAHKRNAEREAVRSTRIARLMKGMVTGVGPEVALGRDTTLLRAMVDQAANNLGRDLEDDAEVKADLLETLGLVYGAIGEELKGENFLREALRIQVSLHGRRHAAVAQLLFEISQVLVSKGWWYSIEELLREALAIRRELLGDRHPDTAETQAELGRIVSLSDPDAGGALMREALAIQREVLGDSHRAVARTLMHLGSVEKPFQRGEATLRAALEIQNRVSGPDSPEALEVEAALAQNLAQQAHLDAERHTRAVLQHIRAVLGARHPLQLGPVLTLGGILRRQGKQAEAETVLRNGLSLGQSHQSGRTVQMLGALVGTLKEQNRHAEALTVTREAIAVARPLAHKDGLRLAAHLAVLLDLLVESSEWSEAEATARECLALREQVDSRGWLKEHTRSLLGDVLARQEKDAEAEAVYLVAYVNLLDVHRRYPERAAPYLGQTILSLVRYYQHLGRQSDVAEWQARAAAHVQELLEKGAAEGAAQLQRTLERASERRDTGGARPP